MGRSVEQLGDRFGPGATGVLQSVLGNPPELFMWLEGATLTVLYAIIAASFWWG